VEKPRLFYSVVSPQRYNGIAHDEITVRVCAEYFTIAHPPLFPTASRTLLAACWGIAATVGLALLSAWCSHLFHNPMALRLSL